MLKNDEILKSEDIVMDFLHKRLQEAFAIENETKNFNDAIPKTIERMDQLKWGKGNIFFDISEFLTTHDDVEQFIFLLDIAISKEIQKLNGDADDYMTAKLHDWGSFEDRLITYMKELKSQGK